MPVRVVHALISLDWLAILMSMHMSHTCVCTHVYTHVSHMSIHMSAHRLIHMSAHRCLP